MGLQCKPFGRNKSIFSKMENQVNKFRAVEKKANLAEEKTVRKAK